MNKVSFFTLLICSLVFCGFTFSDGKNDNHLKRSKKVLIFSKTNGYRHESIEAGVAAIRKLGAENNFSVDATEDSLFFTKANLKKYKTVIFLSATGEVLGTEQQKVFQQYIQHGGGFVGVHAATDCGYTWPWYIGLVGASFESHPEQQMAKLVVKDATHLSTKSLPLIWERKDEWYNFKNLNLNTKVLLAIDESSYKGGKNGENHPMAWYHIYDGGRSFYTELGHTKESFEEPLFLNHLLGGIQYAMGDKPML
ncbi:MAG: ThuA domain-containing protein [Sphingobacteriia bacterium]|nr:MAG: ThuA domain-containing protein [Sphingobacteriia bacterium]TAH06861.1 MAG: ThuA domain-containing protein [Sphingobacteriia bacterium]